VYIKGLSHKDDVLAAWQQFMLHMNVLTAGEYKVIEVQCDNAGEIVAGAMGAYLLRTNVSTSRRSAPHTQAQDGKVEVTGRHVFDWERTQRIHAELPPSLWEESVLDVVDKRRLLFSEFAGGIPYTLASGRPADEQLAMCKPFGCVAYCLIPKKLRTKTMAKAHVGIMLGRLPEHKAWRVLRLPSMAVKIVRHLLVNPLAVRRADRRMLRCTAADAKDMEAVLMHMESKYEQHHGPLFARNDGTVTHHAPLSSRMSTSHNEQLVGHRITQLSAETSHTDLAGRQSAGRQQVNGQHQRSNFSNIKNQLSQSVDHTEASRRLLGAAFDKPPSDASRTRPPTRSSALAPLSVRRLAADHGFAGQSGVVSGHTRSAAATAACVGVSACAAMHHALFVALCTTTLESLCPDDREWELPWRQLEHAFATKSVESNQLFIDRDLPRTLDEALNCPREGPLWLRGWVHEQNMLRMFNTFGNPITR
jgi:hypothetical protein